MTKKNNLRDREGNIKNLPHYKRLFVGENKYTRVESSSDVKLHWIAGWCEVPKNEAFPLKMRDYRKFQKGYFSKREFIAWELYTIFIQHPKENFIMNFNGKPAIVRIEAKDTHWYGIQTWLRVVMYRDGKIQDEYVDLTSPNSCGRFNITVWQELHHQVTNNKYCWCPKNTTLDMLVAPVIQSEKARKCQQFFDLISGQPKDTYLVQRVHGLTMISQYSRECGSSQTLIYGIKDELVIGYGSSINIFDRMGEAKYELICEMLKVYAGGMSEWHHPDTDNRRALKIENILPNEEMAVKWSLREIMLQYPNITTADILDRMLYRMFLVMRKRAAFCCVIDGKNIMVTKRVYENLFAIGTHEFKFLVFTPEITDYERIGRAMIDQMASNTGKWMQI